MDICLIKAKIDDAQTLYDMQREAFLPLFEKYQDFDTSPANEPIDKTIARISQENTDFYIIANKGINLGGVRVQKKGNNRYRVGTIFVLPKYQRQGIAQKAFCVIESIYSDAEIWELDTILQEPGNCYLYEKIGYRKTGESEIINDKMTIVFYEKRR
jgi:GNAT superfamily N-acetyltransferase